VCLQCLHFAITRHLIVGSAHEQLPHRCASCKISASSRANTGSVQHTAARSCMVPSAFLQPCTFCKSRLLRPNVRNSHRPLMTRRDVPLTGTHHQQQIMRCLTLCSTIVGHASSDDCYIPALRPSGGAHPIGVWAHTRETTMAACQSRSSGSINNRRRENESVTVVWAAACHVRFETSKQDATAVAAFPSRLFPLSGMSVIPSAWNSRSGGGCNLPEVRSRMRLPNSRCAAMLVYNRPGEPGVLTRWLS
jgi:hypothetical protein